MALCDSADPLSCPLTGCPPPAPPAINGYTLWSSATTWSTLVVPAAGEDVTIDSTMSVILDVSPPPLGRLTVNGRLSFLNGANLSLSAASIVVYGQLWVGNATAPFTGNASIIVTGSLNSPTVLVDNAYLLGK